MKSFTSHRGLVVTMDRANVDTDQIIPKQFLKRIERSGFGEFLFWDWSRRDDGTLDPEFELNRPQAQGASVLVARHNFGCGSSREHAPWALDDYGFRVIIAPSFADIFFHNIGRHSQHGFVAPTFADIFYNNCFKNGMLPLRLSDEEVDELFALARRHDSYHVEVDLDACELRDDHGLRLTFEVDDFRRHCLLHGLDDIGLTLENEEAISAYEAAHGITA